MSTRFCTRDKSGRPMNGINTSKRDNNQHGVHKKKKDALAKHDAQRGMHYEYRERLYHEQKEAEQARVAAKSKAREQARLLDIELGFVEAPAAPTPPTASTAPSALDQGALEAFGALGSTDE
ncbi:hypothetical protein B484DRAFT_392769 [Ochromonadaceae sp. CCMP2298]|nr:hypothetical protein B484DRAFT_392769 [Ochromonadaceae sp. CCMP2298]